MTRLIDADALLQQLTKNDNEVHIGLVMQLIDSMPTVHRDRWISVEDRLPDCDDFLGANFRGSPWMAVCWKFKVHNPNGDYYKYTGGDTVHKNNITHWQPLPSAPTE